MRHNPMDNLSSCRVALQDAMQEIVNLRVKLSLLCDAAEDSWINYARGTKTTKQILDETIADAREMLGAAEAKETTNG